MRCFPLRVVLSKGSCGSNVSVAPRRVCRGCCSRGVLPGATTIGITRCVRRFGP